LLTNFGKFPEARNQFEAALQQAPVFHQASIHLVAIHKISPASLLARDLRASAQHGVWHDPNQGVNVHFTLAKIYQDNGEYDHAFEHYLEGNHLRRLTLHYSSDAQLRFFDSVKRLFNNDFIARKAAWPG